MDFPPFRTAAIVTCHNYGAFLPVCLESLLRQTVPFSEIILVDDASSDDTAAVASRFADRVRYVRVAFRNPALARQKGFEESTAEFVVMIDADDWLVPEFNEKLGGALAADPSLGFAYCGAHYADPEGKSSLYPGRGEFPLQPYNPRLLRYQNYIPNCSLVRRQAWLGQDPALPSLEDWDHWIRMEARGWKGALVPEKLFYYRLHNRNRSQERYSLNSSDDHWRVREKYFSYDLTVMSFFERPDYDAAEVFIRGLERMQKPASTQWLWIDNARDRDFHHFLKARNPGTLVFPHEPHFRFGRKGHRPGIARPEHRSRLLRFASNFVEGRKILLIDARFVPDPGALTQLLEHAEAWSADLLCGCFQKAGRAGVFQEVSHQPGEKIKNCRVDSERWMVFAAGMDFFLADTRLFMQFPLALEWQRFSFGDLPERTGAWLWEKNLRCFVDGSAVAREIPSLAFSRLT
ncbi:MAG TPA: glycosyltransferase [Verrucomicrobiae bacterium]|nr:glycosyltransferase [Verrucomicrobiae bacterium]